MPATPAPTATPVPTPSPTPSPVPVSATASQSISASGGTINVTLLGETATVTVPAGAYSSPTTVTVTLYTPGGAPVKAQAQVRKARSLQAGDTEVADVVIDAGTTPPAVPLQLSLKGAPAPAAGSNGRLEGYNNGSFDDIATMGYASGTYAESNDATFPGVTLTNKTEYVLYTHAGTGPSGDGTVTVSPSSATVTTGSTQTFTASEATANGFPFVTAGPTSTTPPRPFSFSLDNPAAGSITSTTATTATFTAGAGGGTATVTATDTAVSSRTGTARVTASSSRPNLSGTSATYTGTLTENDVNNVIGATPVPSVATYGVKATVTTSASGSNTVFTSNESDTSSLRTINTSTISTVAYQPGAGGTTNVRTLTTVANDSNGVNYATNYGSNNGLVTILPETNTSFSNDAAMRYQESDPGIRSLDPTTGTPTNVSIDRQVNADGSYIQYNGALTSVTAQLVNNVARELGDFSGELDLPSIVPGGRIFQFNAPAGGTITYRYLNGATHTVTPATVPNWIPNGLTSPSAEVDTIATGQSLDPSCTTATSYATATKVTQQVVTADAVLGTLEHRTTTSYDVPGPGTVCTVVSDAIAIFYDYSEQQGPVPRLFPANSATIPVEQITITETLALQSSNAPGTSSASRSVNSLTKGILIPRSLVIAHVEHLAHQKAQRRLNALRSGGSTK